MTEDSHAGKSSTRQPPRPSQPPRPPQSRRPPQSAVAKAGSPRSRVLLFGLLLLVLAVLVQSASAIYYQHLDRLAVQDDIAQQQSAIEQAVRVRAQLDNLVNKTLQLSQRGNPNATRILEQLRATGVNIKGME